MHPRHGSIKMGRFYLALVFFALRLMDALLLFRAYPILSLNDKETFLGVIVAMAIFTTVLLICIWFHQSWARYIFIGLLLLLVVSGVALIPCLRDLPTLSKITLDVLGLLALYLGIAVTVITSKDIERLTSRRFE